MAPIRPPHQRMDLCTTGYGIPPGPLRQWNGHNCRRCHPHPLLRLSPTLPIGADAHLQPATLRILPTSLLFHDLIIGTIIP
jgi:hypothetical protein